MALVRPVQGRQQQGFPARKKIWLLHRPSECQFAGPGVLSALILQTRTQAQPRQSTGVALRNQFGDTGIKKYVGFYAHVGYGGGYCSTQFRFLNRLPGRHSHRSREIHGQMTYHQRKFARIRTGPAASIDH